MRILLINPPHPSIGSRIPREQLPPLGLLSIGGPLIDAGHHVELIDAEFGPMRHAATVAQAIARKPDAVLLGHSGSTSGHPVVAALTCALRAALPDVWIIYGGMFPTYHWREVLAEEPLIDIIVRGEGEETALRLIAALDNGRPLLAVRGIAFRDKGVVIGTAPAPVIADLDACRIGWELIDHARYSYKHQVLATRHMPPWRLIAWVKLIEAVVQLRPRALRRYLAHRDRKLRHGIRWYYRMGRRVWFHEIWNFLLRDRRVSDGPSLAEFWGAGQDAEEEAMHARTRERPVAAAPAARRAS